MQLKPLVALFLTTLPALTAAQPLSTDLADPQQAMQAKPVFPTDMETRAVPAELTSLPLAALEKRQLDGDILLPLIELMTKVLKGLVQGGGSGLGVEPEEVRVMLDELKKIRNEQHKGTMASS
ncbi:uncharacterized protein ACHE_11885A [Aspergillus chevalieri]|uniref:Uncharacterized protein n=1 Tax=Aspergillus chevalieri TaxID=182096 RepID=A0A7R7ZJL3_ASPCH|nr:uncharacterized protein ACHE_11885A [Aspergillus chevalieri]BCR84483.1 hypothetical protein ACHE_11885A [Aspergillus chevalieri]